jgi:hypothetical protein
VAQQHRDPERTPNPPADSPPMNRAQRRAQQFQQRPRREPHGGFLQGNIIKPRGNRSTGKAIPTGDAIKTRLIEKGGSGA